MDDRERQQRIDQLLTVWTADPNGWFVRQNPYVMLVGLLVLLGLLGVLMVVLITS